MSFETANVYAGPAYAEERDDTGSRATWRDIGKGSGLAVLAMTALAKFAPATLAALPDPWQVFVSIAILTPLCCELLPLALSQLPPLTTLWSAKNSRVWGDLSDLFF